MRTLAAIRAHQPTAAPLPLRRRATDAPHPFDRDELADVRRSLAIELALEAELAELAGTRAEVVEALRDKARGVLGHRPGTTRAPRPLAMRRATDMPVAISV